MVASTESALARTVVHSTRQPVCWGNEHTFLIWNLPFTGKYSQRYS